MSTTLAEQHSSDLAELRREYDRGQLIVFAGAGISAAAGLPGWKQLVEHLIKEARQLLVSADRLEEIAEFAQLRDYIGALSALKYAMTAPRFGDAVERLLDDKDTEVPEVALAIAALAPKLRAVLTTNLDHLLEKAFGGKWPALSRATGDVARRQQCIFKLHGTLLERETWVFTREEYDRAVFGDTKLTIAYSALFHSCPILFVGYGLADDDLDGLLGQIRALMGQQPPRHFALLARAALKPFRRAQLEGVGVRLLAYDNPDGKHAEVPAFLRQLGSELGSQPTFSRTIASPPLESVQSTPSVGQSLKDETDPPPTGVIASTKHHSIDQERLALEARLVELRELEDKQVINQELASEVKIRLVMEHVKAKK